MMLGRKEVEISQLMKIKNEMKLWLYLICWHSFAHSLPLSKSRHLLVQVIRTYDPTANTIICIIPTCLSSFYLRTQEKICNSKKFSIETKKKFWVIVNRLPTNLDNMKIHTSWISSFFSNIVVPYDMMITFTPVRQYEKSKS